MKFSHFSRDRSSMGTFSQSAVLGLGLASAYLFGLACLSVLSFSQYWVYRNAFWFKPRWHKSQLTLLLCLFFYHCCPKPLFAILVDLWIPHKIVHDSGNDSESSTKRGVWFASHLLFLVMLLITVSQIWLRLWFTYFELNFAQAFS